MNKFATIVEDIQKLSIEEIEEINHITKNMAIQARRDEFLANAIQSEKELLKSKSYSTSDSLFSALKGE